MTESEWVSPWWEPPLAGDEAGHLVGALDRLRTTFRYKVDELDAEGLNTRIGASSITLGGLMKHLAANEDYMFTVKFRGLPLDGPWLENGWRDDNDWEFNSAAENTPEELYALWDGAVERSRKTLAGAIADGGLGQPADISWPNGQHASLRRLVCDLIEEYGRHTGHADLIREAVDGRVGEDPPRDWKPVGAKQH
ncbi:mycothiol transferase [Kribbella sp. NPDC054772]